jgi:SpoVK/Ycf46/Vps4 family AAA+-type ATPase
MVRAMARKNRTSLAADALPDHLAGRGLSGADIESIVLDAKRTALSHGREQIGRDDLARAAEDFIPSAQGLEKEKQELAAVLECTSLSFLPGEWRSRVVEADGRARLQERMAAIRRLLEE